MDGKEPVINSLRFLLISQDRESMQVDLFRKISASICIIKKLDLVKKNFKAYICRHLALINYSIA